MNKKLGERIKEARTRAGMNQQELAQKIGIAGPTLSKYEKGHRIPDAVLLNQMVKALKCDPGWLLTGEGEMITEEPSRYEPAVSFRRAEDEDPLLADLIAQLKTIKTHGSPVQFGQVRGIIETIYDELKKQVKSSQENSNPEHRTALTKEEETGKKTP